MMVLTAMLLVADGLFFPMGSIGWRLSEEKFFEGKVGLS